MKTANDIFAIDDRPAFAVEVPEWDLIGDDAAQVRELTPLTMARVSESCDMDGKRDEAKFMARVIIEGCVSPQFGPGDEEKIMQRSNRAARRLFTAIIAGKKKEPLKS